MEPSSRLLPKEARQGQLETRLGETSFPPCPLPWGSTWRAPGEEGPHGRPQHRRTETAAPALLAQAQPRGRPGAGSAGHQQGWAAWRRQPSLLFLSAGTLCFVPWGQVRHCCGVGIHGLRAAAELGWTCWQRGEVKRRWCVGSSLEAKSLNPTQHLQIQLEAEAWHRHCRVFTPHHLPADYCQRVSFWGGTPASCSCLMERHRGTAVLE